MRPRWPRLALRSLVGTGPAGPGCGLGWPRQEWPGVAKVLIRLHLVAFGCIPIVLSRARGLCLRGNDDDAFVGTTHVDNVGVGAAMAQWAVVVGLGWSAQTGARIPLPRRRRHIRPAWGQLARQWRHVGPRLSQPVVALRRSSWSRSGSRLDHFRDRPSGGESAKSGCTRANAPRDILQGGCR